MIKYPTKITNFLSSSKLNLKLEAVNRWFNNNTVVKIHIYFTITTIKIFGSKAKYAEIKPDIANKKNKEYDLGILEIFTNSKIRKMLSKSAPSK